MSVSTLASLYLLRYISAEVRLFSLHMLRSIEGVIRDNLFFKYGIIEESSVLDLTEEAPGYGY